MSALTPFSELPHPFDKPFQPEPDFRYDWLLNEAKSSEALRALDQPVTDLEKYAAQMNIITDQLEKNIERRHGAGKTGETEVALLEELLRGLQVTALRANHRALTLRALLARRGEHTGRIDNSRFSEPLLVRALLVRQQAKLLVQQQEAMYRYPVERMARRRYSLTAYPFGYLYPASNLYFWEREEEQVRQERFDALFMNLWDVRRTLGLESLLFR